MELSFSWHRYSFAFSFWRKKGGDVNEQKVSESGWEGSGSERVRSVSGREGSVSEDDLFEAADRAKAAIVNGIRAQAIRKPGKRELLFYLRQLLASHTQLGAPQAYAFRIAINNAIERYAEEYCSICLTRQDLSLLWQNVG